VKKTIAFSLLAAGLLAGGITGCKKSANHGSAGPTWTPGSDIYIVGTDSGHAVYWKNGVETVLGPGAGAGITISGSSVYVGGVSYKNGTTELAAVWKDGVEQDLTDTGDAQASTPLVVGTDVYVPGIILWSAPQSYAVYWKNGQLVYVDSAVRSWASQVAISGSDVYVLGAIHGSYDTSIIWKNGQRLAGASTGTGEDYSQIVFSGGNMYVVGGQGYFINFPNEFILLPGSGFRTSILLNGSDIYVAGTWEDSVENLRAAYWMDRVLYKLSNYPGTIYSTATGVVVAGSDVYVVGFAQVNSGQWAVYWKNGVEWTLTKSGSISGATLGD
jgi:hypothetical protein